MHSGNHKPRQPAERRQPNGKKQERHAQPQTAALPRGSGAAQLHGQRLVRAAHDSLFQAVELETGKERERRADQDQGKLLGK